MQTFKLGYNVAHVNKKVKSPLVSLPHVTQCLEANDWRKVEAPTQGSAQESDGLFDRLPIFTYVKSDPYRDYSVKDYILDHYSVPLPEKDQVVKIYDFANVKKAFPENGKDTFFGVKYFDSKYIHNSTYTNHYWNFDEPEAFAFDSRVPCTIHYDGTVQPHDIFGVKGNQMPFDRWLHTLETHPFHRVTSFTAFSVLNAFEFNEDISYRGDLCRAMLEAEDSVNLAWDDDAFKRLLPDWYDFLWKRYCPLV